MEKDGGVGLPRSCLCQMSNVCETVVRTMSRKGKVMEEYRVLIGREKNGYQQARMHFERSSK